MEPSPPPPGAAHAGQARFVTPEAVELRFAVAGLGSRFLAGLVDGLILAALAALVTFAVATSGLSFGSPVAAAVAVSLAAVSALVGYFAVFEGLWDGRTPGKRALGIRVVLRDGSPVTGAAAFVRNLLRLVDVLPVLYAVGVVALLATRHDQRLGDLAAGTLVVRDRRRAPLAAPLHVTGPPWSDRLDVSRVGEREYALARSFLQRRDGLAPRARSELAGEVAAALRPRVHGVPDGTGDEAVIEATVAAVRARSPR